MDCRLYETSLQINWCRYQKYIHINSRYAVQSISAVSISHWIASNCQITSSKHCSSIDSFANPFDTQLSPVPPSADTLDAQETSFNNVRLAGFSGDVLSVVTPLAELTRKVAALETVITGTAATLGGNGTGGGGSDCGGEREVGEEARGMMVGED